MGWTRSLDENFRECESFRGVDFVLTGNELNRVVSIALSGCSETAGEESTNNTSFSSRAMLDTSDSLLSD